MKFLIKVAGLLIITGWLVLVSLPDGKLHIVFCDVGQGDAILILKGKSQILVDGGPGTRVLDCLSKHIPFFDRTIEMVVATHPDLDHIGGLPEVFKRYTVLHYVTVPVSRETGIYARLLEEVKRKGSKVSYLYTGDTVKAGGFEMDVVWPERNWALTHLEQAPLADRSEVGIVLGAKTVDAETNDFSIGFVIKFGDFEALLTGDADIRILDDQINAGRLVDVDVLKVPHHGSKTGMSGEWLDLVKPELAVISVGRTNRYGHPTEEAVKLLQDRGVNILRTDVVGSVELVTDGQGWWIKD